MVGQWEVAALEKSIEEARSRGLTGKGPFEYGPIDRYVVHMSGPPVRLQMPAASVSSPCTDNPSQPFCRPSLTFKASSCSISERAEGLDLARVKVPTPISRFLKLSLGMTFAQAAAHERRHIEQARKVHQRLP